MRSRVLRSGIAWFEVGAWREVGQHVFEAVRGLAQKVWIVDGGQIPPTPRYCLSPHSAPSMESLLALAGLV